MRRRLWKGLAVGLVTGLLGAALALTSVGNTFEQNVGLDWLFHVRGTVKPPPNVALVAINRAAAERLGLPALPRYWPRTIHATLIHKLVKLGASTIIFDVDFRRRRNPANDRVLARAIKSAHRVVLFEHLSGRLEPIYDISGQKTGTVWTASLVPPTRVLADAAQGLAPWPLPKVAVNVFQFWAFKHSVGDIATMPMVALQVHALSMNLYGLWRRMLERAGARGVNTLPKSRAAIRDAADLSNMMVTLRRDFIHEPGLAPRVRRELQRIHDIDPLQRQVLTGLIAAYAGAGDRYINFYGPPGTIPNIPYSTVIQGKTPGGRTAHLNLKGKVVFVGYSDLYNPAQPDRFYTVFSQDDGVDLSGSEIAATAYSNLLTDRTLVQCDTLETAAILLAFGLLLGSGIYLLTAWIAVPLALLATVLYVIGAQYAFDLAYVWLPLATPVLIQLPLALFIGLMAQYFLERGRQKRYSKAVSYYLPEHVARELTDKELDPSALNRVVYGLCFATDMSGFTSISQSLDPSELAEFMNSYFDALAAALKRHNVDVTEFHADTIMCAWTSEGPETLNRRDAPLAALATLEAVEVFNAQRKGVNLNARVGMDEGRFYLGHTGGGGRMGYSILGDCANTAARLESLNKHLKTHILASGAVVSGADHLLLRPVGQYVLVGKSAPLPVFEVLAATDHATPAQRVLCERFAEAFEAFRSGQWARAIERFEAILGDFPNDGPTLFHLGRCRGYLAESAAVEDPTVVLMNAK